MKHTVVGSALATVIVIVAVTVGPLLAQPPVSIPVEGLEEPVRVVRDHKGIAHVNARNSHDLYFVQGYIHARDRLFQMDVSRRTASGTLAELLGPAALASDVQLRTLGLRRAAQRSWEAVSADARSEVEAYVAGVNAAAAAALPPEYAALERTRFEPWTPVDSVVIAKLIAFGLSFDLDIDLTLTLAAYSTVGEQAGFDGQALFFEDLFRSEPFDPASTVPDASSRTEVGMTSARAMVTAAKLNPQALALIRSFRNRARTVPLLAKALQPRERIEGSNEWAVAGRFTASGRPLIANDPHLALDNPSTFYPIHLRSAPDGINVSGMTFPGAPYVIIGQNQYLTWGATTNPMDVTDTFLEVVVQDPASPSGLSTLYQGVPEPIVAIPEVFRYNPLDGTADSLVVAPPDGSEGFPVPQATLIVPRRNQGPIIDLDAMNGLALSVQYVGFAGTRELDTFRGWNRARNLEEFQEGLQHFDVGSQNWVYADIHGNIAYFTSGEMPVREDLQAGIVDGLPPWFVRDGTGGNEWAPATDAQSAQTLPYEILPQDELPHVVNPPSGFFVNANNDPAGTTLDNDPLNQLRPGGGIYYLNPGYAPGFRAGRITRALQERLARGPVTAEDMSALQADVRLLDAEVFTPHILDAFEAATRPDAHPSLAALGADPDIAEAVSRLADWDYSSPTGIDEGYDASDVDGQRLPPSTEEVEASIAATVYSVWRGQVIRGAIDAALEPFGLPLPGSAESVKALRHLLDEFPSASGVGASGLTFFPFPGIDDPEARRDAVLLQSLRNALDLLASDAFADAFGGSTDQNDYRWGYLHRLVLDHPLGFDIPTPGTDPLPGLAGFPVDGGFGAVDASSHSARADGVNEFMFGSGPNRRYVGEPGTARSSIVGDSALPGSVDAAGENGGDVLARWLTNDGFPVLLEWGDVVAAAASRVSFEPVP